MEEHSFKTSTQAKKEGQRGREGKGERRRDGGGAQETSLWFEVSLVHLVSFR